MDTHDSPRSATPARYNAKRSVSPIASRFGAIQPESAPSPISLRVAVRGAVRYWWLVLALWVVGSAAIGVGIYMKVRPAYMANCLIRIDPSRMAIYNVAGGESVEVFMNTQVQLMTSSNVLSAAANNPLAAKLARIQNARDPILELRKVIQVSIRPGTYLLDVAMYSESPNEAAVIVNAVVEAYMASNTEWSDGMTRTQIKTLENYQIELDNKGQEYERRWRELIQQSSGEQLVTQIPTPGTGKAGEAGKPTGTTYSMGLYSTLKQKQFENKLALLEAEAWAAATRKAFEYAAKNPGPAIDKSRIDDLIRRKFMLDPEAQALTNQMQDLQDKIEGINAKTRNGGDPAVLATRKKLDGLHRKWENLWAQKSEIFAAELSAPGAIATDPEREVHEADRKVALLRIQSEALDQEIAKLQVTGKKNAADEVDITLVRQEHESIRGMQEIVKHRLEQLRFEQKGEARVKQLSPATPPGNPISDKRAQYLAMTPFGVLGVVLGLVVLLEIRSARVADTDLLSARIRNEVFSIAPLPDLRSGDDPNDEKAEQRLARFVQSLDHLRVALCEGGGQGGEGRCVMITSATGGEGKTTLSAHLAARCANAGTSTLLIDADMRRASLGRLLDVPVGLGLADVLAGDVELDSALITVQAGGFHFLSAGMPGRDPSQVLKSARLAELIGRLRQTYDLVIIDTPPVLPVADALIMGRWADGAVMAARYDASRLPLVERANRQLAVAGIPVLGVVVNGVRGNDANYGNYAYSHNYPGRQTYSADSVESPTA